MIFLHYYFSLIFLLLSLFNVSDSALSSSNIKKGIEVRVCRDRDCITDGGAESLEIIKELAKTANKEVSVSTCGCLGPCGSGPNVDLKIDGIRVKDKRVGQNNYYLFRKINSSESAAQMLELSGASVPANTVNKMSKSYGVIQSTRTFFDFDRTTRIALQRLLYVVTALPLLDANQNGTWDVINGIVYPNSYIAIATLVFIGSQFMGTGSKDGSVDPS